jgi:hypothetical protein
MGRVDAQQIAISPGIGSSFLDYTLHQHFPSLFGPKILPTSSPFDFATQSPLPRPTYRKPPMWSFHTHGGLPAHHEHATSPTHFPDLLTYQYPGPPQPARSNPLFPFPSLTLRFTHLLCGVDSGFSATWLRLPAFTLQSGYEPPDRSACSFASQHSCFQHTGLGPPFYMGFDR